MANWIYTVNPNAITYRMSDDRLLDALQDCGVRRAHTNRAPSLIRALFAAAVRRGLLTKDEAAAGLAESMKVYRANQRDERKANAGRPLSSVY